MLRKPPYSECRIFYDGQVVEIGHYLRTPAGSAYRIQNIRQDRRRVYRRHLTCLRWPVDEIPAEATVHPLYWYPRKKKRVATVATLAERNVQ